MTLNKTWKECISLWRWVAKQIGEGSTLNVFALKSMWMSDHGFSNIESDCFFCEYTKQHDKLGDSVCAKCPGRKVDKNFSCTDNDYNYKHQPVKFYNKIAYLNRKRQKK